MTKKDGKSPKRRKKQIPAAGGFKTPVLISKAFNVDEEQSKILLETFEKVTGNLPKEIVLAVKTKNAENDTVIKAIKYGILESLGVFMSDANELVVAIDGDSQAKVVEFDEKMIAELDLLRQGHTVKKTDEGEDVIVVDGAVEEAPEKKIRKKASKISAKLTTARKKKVKNATDEVAKPKSKKTKKTVAEILEAEKAKTKKASVKKQKPTEPDDGEILKR